MTVFKVQLLLPITMYQIIEELTKCSSDTFRSQELLSFVDQGKMTQNPGDGSMTTLQRLGEVGQILSSQKPRPDLHRFCVVQWCLKVGLQYIPQPVDKKMTMSGSSNHVPLVIN